MTNKPQPTAIFVIGTASLDVLHFAGQTVQTGGGAGLYTALAAQKAGAATTLVAPRPQPMPAQMAPAAQKLSWIGPRISPEALPRLEIEHHGGGKATLVDASWGAEAQLSPESLPAALFEAEFVHIAALSSAARQLAFLRAIWQGRGSSARPKISVGTYARLVYDQTEQVRELFDQADLFFMNDNEAAGLFGSVGQAITPSGKLLFVTLGEAGAWVIEGGQKTKVPGQPTAEFDPTGAGDTFCGATLAGLAQGHSPLEAAQAAVRLAAETVSGAGPAALLAGSQTQFGNSFA